MEGAIRCAAAPRPTVATEMTLTPAEVFPVCSFVLDEIEARGWSLDDLAARMGGNTDVNRLALDFLIYAHDERGLHIGQTMADQLAYAFGVSAQFFVNLDNAYRAARATHPEAGNA